MAKKKRSEYTRQRERIIKVYKRIEEKGYKPLEPLKLKTTKELIKEGTDPEAYSKLLSKLKTKDIKKGLKVYDPETGVIFNYDELKEYEKEKNSTDNTASFYDWLKNILENAILPNGLPMLSGHVWVDANIINEEYNRFKNTVFSQIDKDEKEDVVSKERKEDITENVDKLIKVPYYEMFNETLATLINLILDRPLTQDESRFISDWSDFANGGSTI